MSPKLLSIVAFVTSASAEILSDERRKIKTSAKAATGEHVSKEDVQLGEYPEPTAADVGVTTMRSLIALVPYVGGAADELLGLGYTSPVQKRRDNWFTSLGATLDKLAREGAVPPVEKLVENERFVTATIHATRIAIGTHREEKHRFLRNVLLRVASGKCTSEELWGSYFRFIEDFGAPHMLLLRFFADDERRVRSSHCRTYAQYICEGLGKARRQPYYWLFPIAIADLNARGLCTLRSMEEKFTGADIVTYFGREFMRFVAEYEPGSE
jgi:hypothetical protein